ncbi:hypothetical protein GCM10022221_13790 [Actinocorallia aurea]
MAGISEAVDAIAGLPFSVPWEPLESSPANRHEPIAHLGRGPAKGGRQTRL